LKVRNAAVNNRRPFIPGPYQHRQGSEAVVVGNDYLGIERLQNFTKPRVLVRQWLEEDAVETEAHQVYARKLLTRRECGVQVAQVQIRARRERYKSRADPFDLAAHGGPGGKDH
jgi:hypothetical protein